MRPPHSKRVKKLNREIRFEGELLRYIKKCKYDWKKVAKRVGIPEMTA